MLITLSKSERMNGNHDVLIRTYGVCYIVKIIIIIKRVIIFLMVKGGS